MNIAITTPLESRYYGVWLNGTVWTQADSSNDATALAILDEVQTVAGTYSGTVYEDGAIVTAIDTSTDFDVVATPIETDSTTGILTTDSDATAEDTASVEIQGNPYDIAYQNKSDYKNYIFQQYR